MPESTRPIRALMRGLDALQVMNDQDGVTVSDVAAAIQLPRTTSYRILETLREAGYAYRDHSDERYRLTDKVAGLATTLEVTGRTAHQAALLLAEFAGQLGAPPLLAVRRDLSMVVLASAASSGRLAASTHAEPLLAGALGLAWLAACPREQRSTLLKAAGSGTRPPPTAALEQTARLGYAQAERETAGRILVAMAASRGEQVLGVVGVELDSASLASGTLAPTQLDILRQAAAQICECFPVPAAKS